MWIFLTGRLRRWLVASVALPLAGAAAGRLAASVESHHGAGKASRALRAVARATGRGSARAAGRRKRR